MITGLLFDALLVVALVWIAWRALFGADLFTSIVLYIAFGLLMSLAWVRLRAPDIALAEAAIGAGLTGALFLDAARQLGRRVPAARGGRVWKIATITAGGVSAAMLVWVIVHLGEPGGLARSVSEVLGEAGVAHPVTAVLLNLRAYDTWLETGVLVLAVLGAFAIGEVTSPEPTLEGPREELTDALAAVMLPALVVVAGLLLWLGTRAPGGAFQAGAVLGSAGVLLLLLSRWSLAAVPSLLLRVMLAFGFAAFLLAALLPLVIGERMLHMRAPAAGTTILLVEAAVMVTVGVALAMLFVAARSGIGAARRSSHDS